MAITLKKRIKHFFKSTNLNRKDLTIITIFFIANLIIHSYNVGKFISFSDEGVYLYAAKLISEGFLPYKDFFLAHPPFLIYVASFLLQLAQWNINIFHVLIIIWFFVILYPLYMVVFFVTKSRMAAALSLLFFSTFREMVQWDVRLFALRQMALPFLAFALYFLYVKFRPRIAGVLLGLFAISLFSNLILAICLLFLFILGEIIFSRNAFMKNKRAYVELVAAFSIVCFLGYMPLLVIHQAISNVVDYQTERFTSPFPERLDVLVKYVLQNNWPIFIFGLLGSLFVSKKTKFLGLFNIPGLVIVVLFCSYFFPHYASVLGIGLSIGAGILLARIEKIGIAKALIVLLVVISIYISSFKYLKNVLVEQRTPEFFQAVEVLKRSPEPVFTYEPIYALYANKQLPHYYHAADMRYFGALRTNLDVNAYNSIVNESNTIIIEPMLYSMLPSSVKHSIMKDFTQVYSSSNSNAQIYVRKRTPGF